MNRDEDVKDSWAVNAFGKDGKVEKIEWLRFFHYVPNPRLSSFEGHDFILETPLSSDASEQEILDCVKEHLGDRYIYEQRSIACDFIEHHIKHEAPLELYFKGNLTLEQKRILKPEFGEASWKVRLVLHSIGKLEDVEAAVKRLGFEHEMYWNHCNFFSAWEPKLKEILTEAGITEEEFVEFVREYE